jgi:hypothetical protein
LLIEAALVRKKAQSFSHPIEGLRKTTEKPGKYQEPRKNLDNPGKA